ncbi:hypothetical protein HWV62_28398 [Athelia sp. TMB]|nr:hypothetical protein HWV62_28398 [Athelia sp. TMB]
MKESNLESPENEVSTGKVVPEAQDKKSDDPTAKVWSIYLSETAHYDAALVESWTRDMDGLLIFAGLFSASVTAMIVESYKNLSPDPGDRTVALLLEISKQLGGNYSAVTIPNINSFQPTASTLRVNVFWFLSLSLALTCALAATLVQQWARSYLQAVQRRPAPQKKARIRSYLYQGMQKFGMPALVESIPTLLHTSVFLFFAGLADFLYSINRAVALVIVGIVAVGGTLYTVVTILPIIDRQCPYRTPISQVFWYLAQILGVLRYRDNGVWKRVPGSMAQGREMLACADLPGRKEREIEALSWTLDSLTEDSELLPFVEAIPAFLSSESGSLSTNQTAIVEELPFFTRAIGLLLICKESGSLVGLFRRKRAIASMNAISCLYARCSTDFSKFWSTHEGLICSAVMPMTRDEDEHIAAAAMATAEVIVEHVQRAAIRHDDSQMTAWAMDALYRWESLESLVEMIPDFLRTPQAALPSFGRDDLIHAHSPSFIQDVIRMFRCYYMYLLLQSCQRSSDGPENNCLLRRRALACMRAMFYLSGTPEGRVVLADTRTPIIRWAERSKSAVIAQYAICTVTRMASQVQEDIIQALTCNDVQDHQSNLALSRYLRDLRAPKFRPLPPPASIDTGNYGQLQEHFEHEVHEMKDLCESLPSDEFDHMRLQQTTDQGSDLPNYAKVALYRGRIALLLKLLDSFACYTQTTMDALELVHETIQSMGPHLTARYSCYSDQERLLRYCRELLLPLASAEERAMCLRPDDRTTGEGSSKDVLQRISTLLLVVLGTISARDLMESTKDFIQEYLEAAGVPNGAAIQALRTLETSEPLESLEDEGDPPSREDEDAGMITASTITQVEISFSSAEIDLSQLEDLTDVMDGPSAPEALNAHWLDTPASGSATRFRSPSFSLSDPFQPDIIPDVRHV